MPLDDDALWLCGGIDFNDRIVMAGPQRNTVDIALNKRKQVELARAAGFNVPWTRFVDRPEEALAGPVDFPVDFQSASLAVAAKGAGVSKGRKAWICSDRQELAAAVASWAGRGPMLLRQVYSRQRRRGVFWIGDSARRHRMERSPTIAHDESPRLGCQRLRRSHGSGSCEPDCGRRSFLSRAVAAAPVYS